MKTPAQKRQQKTTLLWLIIILFSFLITNRLYIRIDATANKINTVSDFSKNLARSLDEPLTITYFVSQRLYSSHHLPGYINDFLIEYAAASSGMIRYIKKDVRQSNLFSGMDTAEIHPRHIEITERNETAIVPVYSVIQIEYLDRCEILPSVFDINNLEYSICSKILSLLGERKKEIGILPGDPSKDFFSEYLYLAEELEKYGFLIKILEPGEYIYPWLDCLFVIGGTETLGVYDLQCIEEYIQGGGNVLFAVDAVTLNFDEGISARISWDNGLLEMLDSYGLSLQPALLLDESCLSLNLEVHAPNGMSEIKTIRYPPWPGISSGSMNNEHPLSHGFTGIDLYWASPIELLPVQDIKTTPLFFSSDNAWIETDTFSVELNDLSFFDNADKTREAPGRHILGAAATLPNSSRLIVIGDADFAGSLMGATLAKNKNCGFIVRSALWLSGSEELLKIIKKDKNIPGLDRIQNPEKRNSKKNFAVILNVFILPFILVLTGLTVIRVRKNK